MIGCTHPSVRPIGRWFRIEEKIVATAAGSRFHLAFRGKMVVLHFLTTFMSSPHPHLWIRVDGGAATEVPVDEKLRICVETDGNHIVEVIHKSAIEMAHRWYQPLDGRVEFLGYEADAPGELPPLSKKTIEFVGDSITEGVLIDHPTGDDLNWWQRPFQDDVTATYAWNTAQLLGLEPVIMGYGAVGVTRGGCGAVPEAQEAYPYCFNGAPISYSNCDYIVINHGTNDRSASFEVFRDGYFQLLDVVCAHNPNSRIFVLSPFCGAWATELDTIVREYSEARGRLIEYICSAGWIDPERIHPGRDGHICVAENLARELRARGVK